MSDRRRTRLTGPQILAILSLGLSVAVHRLSAQSIQPELVFSASGGFTFSRPLWALRQPVTVPVGGTLLQDTFLLVRGLASGWSIWAGITRYPAHGIGWGAEIGWLATGVQTGCSMAGTPYPDPENGNLLACGRIPYVPEATRAVPLLATATWRIWGRRPYSPFVKAGAGFALLGGSFVVVRSKVSTSTCIDCVRIILEADRQVVTWAASLAAGVTIGGDAAQRLRVEVRDFVLGLPVVTGPANPSSEHPTPLTRALAVHRITLAIGLDIVTGGRRGRRY